MSRTQNKISIRTSMIQTQVRIQSFDELSQQTERHSLWL